MLGHFENLFKVCINMKSFILLPVQNLYKYQQEKIQVYFAPTKCQKWLRVPYPIWEHWHHNCEETTVLHSIQARRRYFTTIYSPRKLEVIIIIDTLHGLRQLTFIIYFNNNSLAVFTCVTPHCFGKMMQN